MNLIECILTKNECYKSGKKIKPKGIMVHSTGANNPTLRRYVQPNVSGIGKNIYNNDWNRGNILTCVHAFIGKLENGEIATVQTLPWNHRGWHAGGAANNTHISFEICEDGLIDKTYFMKVYTEAVELTAYLCKKYNLDPMADGVVICHSEGYKRGIASNHGDVMHWFPNHGKNMNTFRSDVKKAMSDAKVESSKPVQTNYLVKVTADVLNIRYGAGTNYPVVGQIKNNGIYTIVEEKNGWGKLKSGAGWIKLSYTKKI